MEIIDNKLKKRILSIIYSKNKEMENNLLEIIELTYKNIPASKKISYGIVFTIKNIGQVIYNSLKNNEAETFSIAEEIYNVSKYFKIKSLSLNILSNYGIKYPEKVLPFFTKSANSENWNEREMAAIFFRKIIKTNPQISKKYLSYLTKSSSCYLRRFVAETLRPVNENKIFFNNINYPLSILKNLFKESHPYPRTSVGNNLSDISKKLPEIILKIVNELVNNNKNSYWIAYRACRNLVKTHPDKVKKILNINKYKYKKKIYIL